MKTRIPLLTVLFTLFTSPALAQNQATPVGVDAVRTQPMSQTIPVIGRLVSLQQGVVASRTSGPVGEVRVETGDHVEQGDVIALIEPNRLLAQEGLALAAVKELEASMGTARASEQLALQELQRIEKLRNTAAFNKSLVDTRSQELKVARSRLREAQARIASSQVSLELTRIELADANIRAPFPGTVVLRHVSAGAWLRVGDPVVTLINDQALEIEADVPAERLQGLATGTEIRATLDDGGELTAIVRAIVPNENPSARTRPVRFTASFAADSALAVNQAATLHIPAGPTRDVLTVNKDAILRKNGGAMVYLVADGVANIRPVQLGSAVGNRFEVVDGLKPGDSVVIRGNERLRPGQAVVVPEDEKPAASSS